MSARRCDSCQRWASALHPIRCNPPEGGIDREVCDRCFKPQRPGPGGDQ